MASYNRVVLVGNLTRDPELRYISSGTAVSDIGLAVNERIKRNDQWVEEVNFIDITLWGRTAEVANEYLSKGSSVLIEGRLKYESWEKDGQKRSKLKVVGEKMQMLGGRGEGGGSRGGGGGRSQSRPSQSGGYDSQDYGSQDSNDSFESTPSRSAPPDDDIPF